MRKGDHSSRKWKHFCNVRQRQRDFSAEWAVSAAKSQKRWRHNHMHIDRLWHSLRNRVKLWDYKQSMCTNHNSEWVQETKVHNLTPGPSVAVYLMASWSRSSVFQGEGNLTTRVVPYLVKSLVRNSTFFQSVSSQPGEKVTPWKLREGWMSKRTSLCSSSMHFSFRVSVPDMVFLSKSTFRSRWKCSILNWRKLDEVATSSALSECKALIFSMSTVECTYNCDWQSGIRQAWIVPCCTFRIINAAHIYAEQYFLIHLISFTFFYPWFIWQVVKCNVHTVCQFAPKSSIEYISKNTPLHRCLSLKTDSSV